VADTARREEPNITQDMKGYGCAPSYSKTSPESRSLAWLLGGELLDDLTAGIRLVCVYCLEPGLDFSQG
jgi:hypothetical protein